MRAVAQARYDIVRMAQLAAVYAAVPDTDPDVARRVGLVTVPVAFASVEASVADTIGKVGQLFNLATQATRSISHHMR